MRSVIPAQAGIQKTELYIHEYPMVGEMEITRQMDSRFHGNDEVADSPYAALLRQMGKSATHKMIGHSS